MNTAITRRDLATIITSIFLSMFALGECLQTTEIYNASTVPTEPGAEYTAKVSDVALAYRRAGERPMI